MASFRFSHVVSTGAGLQVVFTANYASVVHWHAVTVPWANLTLDLVSTRIEHARRVLEREPDPDDQLELPW